MRIDYQKYKLINNITNTKIVHISDIHFSNKYKIKRLEIIKNKIKKINPNYICITGDLIDTYDVTKKDNFKYFINWIKEISQIARLIIIQGNHEYIKKSTGKLEMITNIKWLKNLENDNIKILDNEIYTENNISFIGYEPGPEYYFKYKEKDQTKSNIKLSKIISNLNNNYNILLTHAPSTIINKKNYKKINNIEKVNLILSGHTHGGLMPSFIPGNLGLISPTRKLFPRKARGKIKINNTTLIINTGTMKLSEKSGITKYNDIFGMNIIEIDIFTKK
ncbi:MAG: metallophosphoesterase [Bacilli bacterium]|nr:metallophosphoesterase [Bacilli bacterium]